MNHRHFLCMAAGALLVAQTIGAQTRPELKQEVEDMLPSGRKVRMAWSQRPKSGGNWRVYVYDNEENQVRALTTTSHNVPSAYISKNGQYVVYDNHITGEVFSIDFNGQNQRRLLIAGHVGATWQDPDSKIQYAMVSSPPSQTGTWLVEIANPANRRKIHNSGFYDNNPGGIGGVGISVDGLRLGSMMCNGFSGITPVLNASGSRVCASGDNIGGCNFTMRPTSGTAYEWAHFPDGHYQICHHRADGSRIGFIDVASTVIKWGSENNMPTPTGSDEPIVLDFTNDPNFVTYTWLNWRVNPVLFNISTKKWTGINHSMGNQDVGRFSAVILTAGTGIVRRDAIVKRREAVVHNEFYSITGRRLSTGINRNQAINAVIVQNTPAGVVRVLLDR